MNNNWELLAKKHPWIQDAYENLSELERHDSFYDRLQFGTAGMRGLLGIGPNRMNIYTVAKANLGFGKYIQESFPDQDLKVAIAYDNRHQSREFALVSARVLAQFNITCYIFDAPRPTPELSFAVRELSCQGGIVITASHNPKEYNGYKVYDETGCQLIDEKIARVIERINEHEDETTVDIPEDSANIIWLDRAFDEIYKAKLKTLVKRNESKILKIIFTSQHGTAYPILNDLLTELGYDVIVVEEQKAYDPDFSNTLTPNPEEKASFVKAVEYAKNYDADIILSCDPDADRLGIVVKHEGDYVYLTGNQGGSILQEYLYQTLEKLGEMPEHPMMFNTIVTSDLGEKIAEDYGVAVEKTLTGFKYIGDKIEQHNLKGDAQFVFGYEESYGYLIGDFVRDKDALQSCLVVSEAANHYKHLGKTLVNVLEELYAKYGVYYETQVALTLKGQEGLQEIQNIMKRLRNTAITELGTIPCILSEDYQSLENSRHEKLDFPSSNVLKYFLADGSWVAVRPSGTEPKCKFYYCITGKSKEETLAKFEAIKASIEKIYQV